tara:strand:- start:73 stop:273 length:201 start_codon:yes stop_codon:yes gene_type:complete
MISLNKSLYQQQLGEPEATTGRGLGHYPKGSSLLAALRSQKRYTVSTVRLVAVTVIHAKTSGPTVQ